MRKASSVGYTPRAWHLRSYIVHTKWSFAASSLRLNTAESQVYNDTNGRKRTLSGEFNSNLAPHMESLKVATKLNTKSVKTLTIS